jgi:hypothetical protein
MRAVAFTILVTEVVMTSLASLASAEATRITNHSASDQDAAWSPGGSAKADHECHG